MVGEVLPPASDSDEDESVMVDSAWAGDAVETGANPAASWWSWLADLIFGRSGSSRRRLEKLDQAVANHPDAAPNYVLRGELYLQAGEPELAAADFETALDLASARFEREDWGVVSQVMRDRAERGLELARRRSKKR